MIRYYLCDMHQINGDNYLAIVTDPDNAPRYKAIIAPNNSGGIAMVADKDHSKYKGLPGVFQMPDHGLTTKLNALANQAKNAMLNEMRNRGMSVDGLLDSEPYKVVIERCAMHYSGLASFDADIWTMSDV
jgi:hypothetical protein